MEIPGCSANRLIPTQGFRAANTAGCCTISVKPNTPRQTNQTSMMGPNTIPILPVPKRSTANKAEIRVSEIGIMKGSRSGESTFKPSTALSTEMAGVIMLSPKNKAAPKAPAKVTIQRAPEPSRMPLETREVSAKMPPSPLLSARMMMNTYLIITTSTKAQLMSDKTPSTVCDISAPAAPPAASTETLSAYKGEVPMSPKTTPKAPKISVPNLVEEWSWWPEFDIFYKYK